MERPAIGARFVGPAAVICLAAAFPALTGAVLGADARVPADAAPGRGSATASEADTISVVDVSGDSTRVFAPVFPDRNGTCYIYPSHVVIAWGSPDPRPVAVVRERDAADGSFDCRPDSLPGDFIVWNDWAEYFCGMWGDLLFIDSGTCGIRSLIIYDVTDRRQVLEIEGAGETAGWLDDDALRIWVLAATDAPRSLCPEIPEVLGVGVDSLYALNLETLTLRPLGRWRCHALQ